MGTFDRPSRRQVLGSVAALTFPTVSGLSAAAHAAAAETPKRGGRLTLGILGAGSGESIDPAVSADRQDLARLWNLYDNLFRRGDDGRAYAVLLESAEPNGDNSVWTFTLRSGVTWHDGSKVTADDVLYTIKTWSDPKHAGYGSVKALIDFTNVKKRGPLTVEVPLQLRVRDFPSTLTMVSYALVKEGVSNSVHPIGTGPFRFESFTPGVRSVYSANKDYWGGAPYLDELVIDTSFSDQNARLNALLAGKIDAADQLPYALAKVHQSSPRITVLDSPGPSFQGFSFRIDTEPYKDVRVRQALRLVADRPALVDSVLNGFGSVGNDLPGAGDEFFAADLVRPHDIDQAKWLLKQAGKPDLAFTIDTTANNPAPILYQQQAKAAGVTITVNNQDRATYYGNYLKRPVGVGGWDSPLTSLAQFYLATLTTGARFPETRFGTPESDKLLFDAIAENDTAKAQEKWHAVQRLQFDQGGYLLWANANYVDAIGKHVRGVKGSRAGSIGGYNFAKAWIA